ncbi:MAG: hypothetical protein ACOX1F_00985 [Erysipelotrichaceae bacterium]|jgi:predicted N-acyltransferase
MSSNIGQLALKPPLLSEVISFVEVNNLNVDPIYWYCYYQDRNWLIENKPIKNWKGLLKKWDKTQLKDVRRKNKTSKVNGITITRFGEKIDENGNLIYDETGQDYETLRKKLFEKG